MINATGSIVTTGAIITTRAIVTVGVTVKTRAIVTTRAKVITGAIVTTRGDSYSTGQTRRVRVLPGCQLMKPYLCAPYLVGSSLHFHPCYKTPAPTHSLIVLFIAKPPMTTRHPSTRTHPPELIFPARLYPPLP